MSSSTWFLYGCSDYSIFEFECVRAETRLVGKITIHMIHLYYSTRILFIKQL